jgi:hypothetical protein
MAIQKDVAMQCRTGRYFETRWPWTTRFDIHDTSLACRVVVIVLTCMPVLDQLLFSSLVTHNKWKKKILITSFFLVEFHSCTILSASGRPP